jgi:hypothetical protein
MLQYQFITTKKQIKKSLLQASQTWLPSLLSPTPRI